MKTIYIHCGFPKCGTSALQVQFARSRDMLLTHNLNYLPIGDFSLGQAGKIASGNGVNLARAFLPPQHNDSMANRRKEILTNTKKQIDDTDCDVVLSSEFFSAVPAHLINKMVEELSDNATVILIYFVRNQVNLMAANYMQQVKRHRLMQWPEEYYETWDSFKGSLDYYSRISAIKSNCQSAGLKVEAYEKSKSHPQGLMGLILELMEVKIPPEELAKDTHINTSPSPKELRLMLELNKHAPRMEFSDMLVEGSVRALRSAAHASHRILPPALCKSIENHFGESNTKLFDEFIGGENLYSDMGSSDAFIDLSTLEFDASELVYIIGSLMIDMDKRIAKLEARK